MGFRTVKINNRCKLETSLGYLVVRSDSETRILLDEINLLIVENQQICLTAALLSSLIEHKIRVIFCDSQHNPSGELMPYCSCYDAPAKIQKQFAWNENIKDAVWKEIIKQKIYNQAELLKIREQEISYRILLNYIKELIPGDPNNREGLAAKSYFLALFGSGFDRRNDYDPINVYLNYGYSIILSAVNRAVSICGYLSMTGFHHKGNQNPFNLGCDIMEPFRPFIDEIVVSNDLKEDTYKKEMISVLSKNVLYDGQRTILDNAVSFYTRDVFRALETGDCSQIKELKRLDDQL